MLSDQLRQEDLIIINVPEFQIMGSIDDYSKIIFLIPQ